jgi:hypothetical protein
LGAGYLLYDQGILSGAVPFSDRAGRSQAELEGRPQTGGLDLGSVHMQVDRLSPLGNLLQVGAAMARAARDPELNKGQAWMAGGATLGSLTLEQTFLRGLNDLREALDDPAKNAGDYLQQQALTAIPASALVRGIARASDPYVRAPETFSEKVQAAIPGLSRNVPARIDALGQPVERLQNPLARTINELASPLSLTPDRTSGNKARTVLKQSGVSVSKPARQSADGETVDQFRSRQVTTGRAIDAALSRLDVVKFNNLPADMQHDLVDELITSSRNRANAIAKARREQTGAGMKGAGGGVKF